VVIGLVSLVVMLVLAEFAVRIYAKAAQRERGNTYDPDLGWRLTPGIRKVSRHWGLSRPAAINSKGWRDVERAYERRPGVRRVVAVGDSLTFGARVDDGERFSEVLERRFDRLEVVNLGVPAYGTDQELLVLELDGFRYAPDIVLLVTCLGNDLEDIRHDWRWGSPKPYYTLADGDLRLTKPRPTLGYRLRSLSYLAEQLHQRLQDPNQASRLAPEWQTTDPVPLFAALVRRMAEQCARREIKFLVVLAYYEEGVGREANEQERRVYAALEEARIATLDTRPPLAERARAGEALYDADRIHWNAHGHEVAAGEIAKAVCANGWLP
jgi:lysophospholipase L1-like esterase